MSTLHSRTTLPSRTTFQSRATLVTLGFPVLLALALGGSTTSRLTIDAVLLFALATGAALTMLCRASREVPREALLIAALPPLLVAAQLVPLPAPLVAALQGALPPALEARLGFWRPISLDPAATWDALVWTGTLSIVLLAMLRLPAAELRARSAFLFLAVALHMVLALAQAGSGGGWSAFGYEAARGFFANANHFATLVVMLIPLAFAYLGQTGYRWAVTAFCAVAVVMLVIAGSRMGYVLGFAAIAGSLVVFKDVRAPVRGDAGMRVDRRIVLALGAAGALVLLVTIASLAFEPVGGGGSRLEFLGVTLAAALDNPLLGTGFGTFADVYERYEGAARIGATFVNEAHNEPVQLLLEGGLPALGAAVVIGIVLVRRITEGWALPFTRAAALSLGLLAVHSLVDYPLRTLSVGLLAVMLVALLFEEVPRRPSDAPRARTRRRRSTARVEEAPKQAGRPVPAGADALAPRSARARTAQPGGLERLVREDGAGAFLDHEPRRLRPQPPRDEFARAREDGRTPRRVVGVAGDDVDPALVEHA